MKIEKVLLIGRGAVGVTMGNICFEHLPRENFAFLVDPERRVRYENDPLEVNGQIPEYRYVSKPEEFGQADLILIATKYGGLPRAMELVRPFVKEETIFMPCINGIVSEEDLRQAYPEQITLRTIAQKMDAVYAHNQVRYTQEGELVFGVDDPGQQEAAQAVRQLFDAIGLPYIYSQDIVKDQWSKLMANCGINQTCAAYHGTYGTVTRTPELLAVFKGAMEEVRQVANACGIDLTSQDVEDWAQAMARLDPDSMPSMAQDVLAGRQTEEQLFSATVVPMAHEKGIDVPILEMLMEKVQALDAQNRQKNAQDVQV